MLAWGDQVPHLRMEALAVLESAVGGDQLVAEYLLMQLICRRATSLYVHSIIAMSCAVV